MVVKKFEARSMKEALEMVKSEMGPEAIIVAARDNSKRYGLVGEGSVEITAAIQEASLQKKHAIESRIPAHIREKVHRGSAKAHRELIEKATARSAGAMAGVATSKKSEFASGASYAPAPTPRTQTAKKPMERTQRYIDMSDDVEPAAAPNGANERLRVAAQQAWTTMQKDKVIPGQERTIKIPEAPSTKPAGSSDLLELKNEINDLRKIFKNMDSLPQNFVKGHPGSDFGLKYEFAELFERLLHSGLNAELAADLLKRVQSQIPEEKLKQKALIQGLLARELAQDIAVTRQSLPQKYEVFVGAGGHGKTSMLIKYAAHLVLNEHLNVAILTTDSHRFGASEQLKIYAQILNIPFTVISNESQWSGIAQQEDQFDKILIDTGGVRFRDQSEMDHLKEILPPGSMKSRIHLVLSATSKDQDAIEIGKRFATLGFDDVIFTALDESVQHGVVLNFQKHLGKPLHSFGIGPKVPEDFEFATPERIIDLLLGRHMDEFYQSTMNQ